MPNIITPYLIHTNSKHFMCQIEHSGTSSFP